MVRFYRPFPLVVEVEGDQEQGKGRGEASITLPCTFLLHSQFKWRPEKEEEGRRKGGGREEEGRTGN